MHSGLDKVAECRISFVAVIDHARDNHRRSAVFQQVNPFDQVRCCELSDRSADPEPSRPHSGSNVFVGHCGERSRMPAFIVNQGNALKYLESLMSIQRGSDPGNFVQVAV
ncbi:MAG: hypothetical protein ACRD1R_00940 [Acidobacteriota bacterium]